MKYQRIDYWKYMLKNIVRIPTGIQLSRALCIRYDEIALAELLPSGLLTIYPGYCWDGATCAIDTPTFMTASLVHDVLYQMIRMGLLADSYRITADQILYELCVAAGMSWFRAQYVYKGVRWFGAGNAKPLPQDLHKIYEVQ